MDILGFLKKCLFIFLLFGMDQLVSIPQMIAMYTHPNIALMTILVFVYVITAAAAIVFFFQFYRYKLKKNHSVYGNHRFNQSRIKFMVMMVVIWVVFLFLQTWYTNLVDSGTSQNQSIINQMFKNMPVWTFIDGVLIAPVMEELIFRGLFFEFFFRKDNPTVKVVGIIVNGILFGGLHDTSLSFPIYAVMGMLLAWTYVHTKDVKYSIAIHVFNNFIAFL